MTVKSSDIAENAKRLIESIAESAVKAGRSPEEVRLMAVTKQNSAERVNQAIAAGVTLLGENRAQELLQKYDDYRLDGCELHFIGHLQTNKVKAVAGKVSMVQSVDRLSLLKELNSCCRAIGKSMDILVEINIGREQSKSGVLPEELEDFLALAAQFEHIKPRGLMAIPPNTQNSLQTERYFEQIYRRFIDIRAKKMDNVCMDILSMGMSQDYHLAVRHGSNIVRIGRGLFGERQ